MVACPTCGGALEYIEQYNRYYCYTCNNYAPKDVEKGVEPAAIIPCPSCGKELTYIPEYDRYYCYPEGKYAPKGIEKTVTEEKPKVEKPCPTCGKPLTYVEEYDRWYCNSCKKYAPREEVKPAEVAAPRIEPVVMPAMVEPAKPVEVAPPVEKPAGVVVAAAKVEEAPKEEAPAAEKPAEAAPAPSAAPSPAPAETPPAEKPPLEKRAIERGKKSYLIDLCKAYGLDTSGSRPDLKARLLDFMVSKGYMTIEEEEKEEAPAEAVTAPAEKIPEAVKVEEKPAEIPTPAPEAKPAEAPAVQKKPAEVPVIAAVAAEKPQEAPKPAPPPAPKPAVAKVLNPCPTCGRELTFIKTYNRYYCYNCRKYAPEVAKVAVLKPAAPATAAKPAPAAARPTALAAPARAAAAARPEAKLCPTCGGNLTYIRQYDKWYCYNCKKYAPEKEEHPCPTCGAELTFIEQYGRWYCAKEKKYAPEKGVRRAPVAAEVVRVEKAPVAEPHSHGGNGTIWAGVSLAILGLVFFLIVQITFYLPPVFDMKPIFSADPTLNDWKIVTILQFMSGLFLVLAVVTGLVGARRKKAKA